MESFLSFVYFVLFFALFVFSGLL